MTKIFKLFGIKKRTCCETRKEDAAVDVNDRYSISSIMMESIDNCNSIQELRVMIEASRKFNLPHHKAVAKERIPTLSNKKRHVKSIDNNNDVCDNKKIISLCSSTSLPNLKKWSHDAIPPPFRSKAFIAPSRYQGLWVVYTSRQKDSRTLGDYISF